MMRLPRMSRYALPMRSNRRLLLTGLTAFAVTSLLAPSAHACMCTDWTQEERIDQADFIFRGRAVSREPLASRELTMTPAAFAADAQKAETLT